ncbi:phosphoglycerate kinase [Clostridium sp. CAG:914]|nr:phosphoglycerate kinase [Clostridium sp. CAG:914]
MIKLKKVLSDFNFDNKRVILRCDLNVPITNGIIEDDTRIIESLKTIKYLIDKNAKVIILSHLGRVKTEEDKKDNSLYPVYLRLRDLLGDNVCFSKYTSGNKLKELVNTLRTGEILLVENTRFEDIDGKKESSCDLELSKYWASLGDIFVNDAYGVCHRSHASNVGISKFLPSCLGLLVEEEIEKIDGIIKENTSPYILLMGGKKISDKTLVIESLIEKCDYILLGGGMCFTFLASLGINVGMSIVDKDNIPFCKEILSKYKDKIILPVDVKLKSEEIKDIDKLTNEDIAYDIGPKTIELFKKYLSTAHRVVANGPMGVFEEKEFTNGTRELYNYLSQNSIKTLIGGGDSISAINTLHINKNFYHISTGGGATLEYIAQGTFPAIEAIEDK